MNVKCTTARTVDADPLLTYSAIHPRLCLRIQFGLMVKALQ